MPAARILTLIAMAAIVAAAFTTPSRAEMSPALQRVHTAVRNQPTPVPVPRGAGAYSYYDMKIDRLCGSGSISEAATNWVDEPAFSETGRFPGTIRTIAMSVTFSFPETDRPNVTLPLVVGASNTAERVQNCDSLIFTNIPRNEKTKVRIDFAVTEGFRLSDPSSVIGSIGRVVSALGALTGYGGSPAIAGTSAVVSFLTANTKPVTDLTNAMNELLALLDAKHKPWSTINPIEAGTGRLSHRVTPRSAQSEVFAMQKGYKDTMLVSDPTGPFSQIPQDYSRLVRRNWDDIVADVMNANPAFHERLDSFCPAFRRTLSRAVNTDPVAVALGLYYHAASNSDSYLQAPASGRTCLNTSEINQLIARHWIKPFEGVLSFQKAAWPTAQTQVAAR